MTYGGEDLWGAFVVGVVVGLLLAKGLHELVYNNWRR